MSEHLYIHIPFCKKKCRYCDFYSLTTLSLIPDYVPALVREIELSVKNRPGHARGKAATVYFGGGTPSLLPSQSVETILLALDKFYGLGADTEITFEANPGTLDKKGLQQLQATGVNRLSLGVQSFDPEILAMLGRIHGPDEAVQAVEQAQNAGFKNIGLDLIFATPGQDETSLEKQLDQALALEPTHLSCYMLTLEPGTPLHALHGAGRFSPMPKPDQVDLFLSASKLLTSRGWDHYEISNYARSVDFRSRHNSACWQMVPYIGFGPGAHSYTRSVGPGGEKSYIRSWNPSDLTAYINALQAGQMPKADREVLTLEQRQMEWLMVGLRTAEGLSFPSGQALFQNRFLAVFQDVMAGLVNQGLAREAGQRFMLTLQGWARLDSIIQTFVERV